MGTADEEFEAVERALLDEPGTSTGTGFGSSPGVTVDGRIAAMLVGGRLVVKLPADRCHAVIEGGEAELLSMGRRTMREWVSVGTERADEWVGLAREALGFVAAR